MPTRPASQIAPVYHRRIGDILVTALSDGTLERTHEMMREVPADEGQRRLAAAFRSTFIISVNAFLIYAGDRLALVETGSGNYLGASAGHLLANLTAAGVKPAEIDTILLTHMHPDHSAGLTDLATGKANYPNAELVVHENEPKHWFDDAAMARGTDREKKLFFQQAREQTAPYLKRMRTFTKGEVFPGVTAIPLHGHTPGHTGYLVESGGERLLIWGDVVHMPEVQVPRPEVSMVVDSDPDAAAATRRRVFDMVASERLLVTGMHLHFPGFGHIARDGAAYRFVPEAWKQSL
ncbi:MAG TPA: MBL fold metallo-hydrolase [Hyphomicrobiaceae bacterium]|nr:MBL fold metallo-hydrolase [Hyphomicrobiaceae bacterium]